VTLPGSGNFDGQVVVSAIGDSDVYCHVENWYTWHTDLIVIVDCRSSATGTPVDTDLIIAATS
jgi:hypothetical protein